MAHRYIGQRLPKVDAPSRVTGSAVYAADIKLPGMLYAKALRSPHAHARILSIDSTQALSLDGVKGVVTAADLPPLGDVSIMSRGEVEVNLTHVRKLALAHDKALFHGHPVAVVAATSPHIAEDALSLIKVEYQPLPPVLDPEAAMAQDAPIIHADLFTQTHTGRAEKPSNIAVIYEMGRGDVEQGFRQAEVVLENTFRTQVVHQGYLEPLAAVAMIEADGRIVVWSSTQGLFSLRAQIAGLFSIPASRIKVIPVEVGGGFGGKLNLVAELPAILLARKTGHPVKMVLTREEVLRASYPAPAATITLKMGATREGRLTAVQMKAVFDAGAFPASPVVASYLSALAPYKVPFLQFTGYEVVTNKPKVGALRAPGAPQGAFAMESQMDMLAERLKLDPLALRQLNAAEEGDPLPVGRELSRVGLKTVLEQVSRHPAWTASLEGPHRGRGLAVGFWMGGVGPSSAHIALSEDGSLALTVGSVDLTGSRTSLRQIAAEELQVDPTLINIATGDTDSVGYTEVSGGSRITYSMGTAVHRACRDLLSQLKEWAATELGTTSDWVIYDRGVFRAQDIPGNSISLADLGRLSLRHGGPLVGRGAVARLRHAPVFAAHVADVEVDPDTGKVKVLNYTAFQDAGRAVNPAQVEGQIQGGAVQGLGWALLEGYQFDGQGMLLNATLLDYRMPTALDVPPIEPVIVEVPASDGPYGIRGVGEAPIIPPLACLANAIYRATGARLKELPMTPEAIFWAMRRRGR